MAEDNNKTSISPFERYNKETTRELIESKIASLKSRGGKESYRKVFNIFSECTCKDFFECGPSDFKIFREWLSKEYDSNNIAYSTMAKYYKIIAGFINWASKKGREEHSDIVPEGFINYLNDQLKVIPPADVLDKLKVPTPGEVDHLIEVAYKEDSDIYMAVLFSSLMGLKTGEFLDIKKKDLMIDSEGNYFLKLNETEEEKRERLKRLRAEAIDRGERYNPKADENLILQIPSGFGKYLDSVVSRITDDDYIFFVVREGAKKQLSRSGLRKKFLKVCEAAGLSNITFNSIRNSTVASLASNGADESILKGFMRYQTDNHIRRLTTLVYPTETYKASKYIQFTAPEEE